MIQTKNFRVASSAIKIYLCPVCEEAYGEERGAEECCPQEIEEAWACSNCNSIYKTENEAIECCADVADADALTPAAYQEIMRQLEAAGQQRLVP